MSPKSIDPSCNVILWKKTNKSKSKGINLYRCTTDKFQWVVQSLSLIMTGNWWLNLIEIFHDQDTLDPNWFFVSTIMSTNPFKQKKMYLFDRVFLEISTVCDLPTAVSELWLLYAITTLSKILTPNNDTPWFFYGKIAILNKMVFFSSF